MGRLLILAVVVGVVWGRSGGRISEVVPLWQPELDQLSLQSYIRDEALFNHQINCLLFDGPCDRVGRWMKPRMASYLLSGCVLCTPNQEKESLGFIQWLFDHQPQLFRIAVRKYLDANGISLPKTSRFREKLRNMDVPPVLSVQNHVGSQQRGSSSEFQKEDISPAAEISNSEEKVKNDNFQENDEEEEKTSVAPEDEEEQTTNAADPIHHQNKFSNPRPYPHFVHRRKESSVEKDAQPVPIRSEEGLAEERILKNGSWRRNKFQFQRQRQQQLGRKEAVKFEGIESVQNIQHVEDDELDDLYARHPDFPLSYSLNNHGH